MDKTSTRSQWKKYYDTGFWQNRRKIQLKAHPLCAFCAAKGLVVPARVVDHVEPHNGDWTKFRTSELQSLCFDCHDKTKRNIDLRGYSDDIDDDGWPTDPKHPANRASRRRFRYSIPHGCEPSGIPVTLICGPPASGKTTLAKQCAMPGDVIIDLDACKVAVGGKPWDADFGVVRRAFRYRDQMLLGLASRKTGQAFVIVGAPTKAERHEWCRALNVRPGDVVILDVPANVCIARLQADPARAHVKRELIGAVLRWHSRKDGL
jgi:5-methylcytosine-specific restriction protein A